MFLQRKPLQPSLGLLFLILTCFSLDVLLSIIIHSHISCTLVAHVCDGQEKGYIWATNARRSLLRLVFGLRSCLPTYVSVRVIVPALFHAVKSHRSKPDQEGTGFICRRYEHPDYIVIRVLWSLWSLFQVGRLGIASFFPCI
ncbi:hypothetical protein V8F33_008720 [Rhypophila sp. PSN 637]